MSDATGSSVRVKIDALLRNAGWDLSYGLSVLFEHALPDGTQADYVLRDRRGRPMAALEANRASVDPIPAQGQGKHDAARLGVSFVFLSDGREVRFLDRGTDARARKIAGFYSRDDLDRRVGSRRGHRDLATIAIGRKPPPLEMAERSPIATTRSSESRRCPPKSRLGAPNSGWSSDPDVGWVSIWGETPPSY